jgi:putative membrane protein
MIIKNILICLVALLHLYFLILEMFLWTTPKGLKAFRMNLEKAQMTSVLAANQGLYNGFLAAGLLWSLFHADPQFQFQLAVFFLSCVLVAALYGGYSVGKKIFIIQGVPALLALAFVVFV